MGRSRGGRRKKEAVLRRHHRERSRSRSRSRSLSHARGHSRASHSRSRTRSRSYSPERRRRRSPSRSRSPRRHASRSRSRHRGRSRSPSRAYGRYYGRERDRSREYSRERRSASRARSRSRHRSASYEHDRTKRERRDRSLRRDARSRTPPRRYSRDSRRSSARPSSQRERDASVGATSGGGNYNKRDTPPSRERENDPTSARQLHVDKAKDTNEQEESKQAQVLAAPKLSEKQPAPARSPSHNTDRARASPVKSLVTRASDEAEGGSLAKQHSVSPGQSWTIQSHVNGVLLPSTSAPASSPSVSLETSTSSTAAAAPPAAPSVATAVTPVIVDPVVAKMRDARRESWRHYMKASSEYNRAEMKAIALEADLAIAEFWLEMMTTTLEDVGKRIETHEWNYQRAKEQHELA